MDHKSGYERQDSGNVSEVSTRSRSSTLNEEQTLDQHAHRSSIDSGISNPMRKNGNLSRPVDSDELKTTPKLQLTVTGPGGNSHLLHFSADDTVDKLIECCAMKFGLGKAANVQLVCGTTILVPGTNQTLRQANIADKSNLQLVTRCVGG